LGGRFQVELFGRVAEDESAAALAAGVHDRPFARRRELLEHLGTQALDILNGEAPEAASGKVNRPQKSPSLPVSNGVLVHA
jgi:hypothetical protein